MKNSKSIEYCLDRTLQTLENSWTPSGERKFLNATELLKEFGLPDRHEFLITIIDKLVLDGYVSLMERSPEDISMIDYYQRRSLITVEGHYFVKDKKSYKKLKNRKKLIEMLPLLALYISAASLLWNVFSGINSRKTNKDVENIQLAIEKLNSQQAGFDSIKNNVMLLNYEISLLKDSIKTIKKIRPI